MARMEEITARDARNRFGRLLDAAQHAPVRVTSNGRGVAVMMSVEQYERLRRAALDGLSRTMDTMAEEAKANRLMESKLDELLAEES